MKSILSLRWLTFSCHIRNTIAWAAMDAVIVLAAYTLTFSTRLTLHPLEYSQALGFIWLVIVSTVGLFYLSGVYQRIWSRTSGHDVTVIVWAVFVSTLVVCTVEAFQKNPLPVGVPLLGNTLALIGFVAVRYRSRLISGLSWRWKAVWNHEFPQPPIPVLIVGAGDMGQVTAWRLKHRAPANTCYRVVCFVDDDSAKQGLYVEGCPVLGSCADIPVIAERYSVELIVIAIHNISGPDFRRILSYCENTNARIKVMPDVFAILNGKNGSALLRDIQTEDFLGRRTIGRNEAVDLSPIIGKVILVTGAAGSIGSELSRQLLTHNPVKLLLLDNNESGLHDLVTELSDETLPVRIIPILTDITDREALNRVFATYRPEVLFHSAAYKHVPMLEHYPAEAVRVNVVGTRQVLEMARDFGAERFVLISTDKAVKPTCVMGASKRICELLVRAFAQMDDCPTLFTAVRFGNVLGSRGSVIPTFNRQIDAGGPVTVTDPDMWRYFMSIPEAANLVIHAGCLTNGGDLFMLNMGDEIRIVELAERVVRMRGLRPYKDIEIKFTGLRPGEKLHEELRSQSEIPCETIHPDIFQLKDENHILQPAAFLAQLDSFLLNAENNGADPHSHLLAMANLDEIAVIKVDPIQVEGALPVHQELAQLDSERSSAGQPVSDLEEKISMMNIPMSAPDITQAEIDAVMEVLTTKWLSLGPKTEQFEGAFAAYVGTKHAISVNSGTSGLHLAMIAAGVGRGDEVITPSFSFIASANCILYEGATPVFVDIDPMTSNLYPVALEKAITERTKAIIAVHAFGQPADMTPILEIARRHNLYVIEDACEAIGSEYEGRRAGTMSDAAVFAFYPNKQMTTGEGGMIVTDNDEWVALFRSLRNQGRDVFDSWLCHSRLGYNYRMDEMSAALGLTQLQRIDELIAKRAQVAAWYDEQIADIPNVYAPYIAPETTRMSWFVYVVRCADHIDREMLMKHLQENGIPSRVYFSPIHLQPFYKRRFEHKRQDLHNTERAGNTFLALPFSSIMTREQVDYVCHHLAEAAELAKLGKPANIHAPANKPGVISGNKLGTRVGIPISQRTNWRS